MFIDPDERYFRNANRPISEIFELLPQFQLETNTKTTKFTGNAELLTALEKHLDNSTDTVLHGLQSLADLIIDKTTEEFEISEYQFKSLIDFISLNLNLVQNQLEVKGNIKCAREITP